MVSAAQAREAKPEVHTFRVHFVGGDYADIPAETPHAARKKAEERQPDALIAKVKILREETA